jgi:enoyl-CoA hydratase
MNVEVAIAEGVATIILNNPPLNILSARVKGEIKETFEAIGPNPEVRVILFKAAGDDFCCGANLKEFPDRIKHNKAKDAWIDGHAMLEAIMNVPQPTVVCVTGNALGGGAELASGFDIRLFAEDVTFGFPEVSRGVFPGNGGLERFMQLCGESNAAFLFLTGERMNAKEALRIGIANKVVEKERLDTEGNRIARLLASYSNPTVQTIKQAVKDCQDLKQFYKNGMFAFESLHRTEDIIESINAFFEKRNPIYRHK